MEDKINYILLALTLLNLGLVIAALRRLNSLRRDLRTPVVKKFTQDFKRKPVDIPKESENSKKDFRPQSRNNQQQSSSQNRQNNQQQNRQAQKQIRRPAAKAPDVFSNEITEMQVANPVPPRPVAVEPAAAEGRRPLPPRFATQEHASFGAAPAMPVATISEEESGMELDRSKMTHGRRNMVKKSMIDDDDNAVEKTI
ncbi:MAG: hypothetical protein LBH25_02320 [Fibromonadaceae bacterium]|jgi:hypothetical protein|nr:hypothetical protein [Fibromonadaceae bacterium]